MALLAGVSSSPGDAAQVHADRGVLSLSAAALDSTAFKLVYTGSYSYDYTATNDQSGAVFDQASASYTWTYAGSETLTAVPGNPSASTASGTYQMTSSGHQSETDVNFDCTLNSGPNDTFAFAVMSDGAVGHETPATPIGFGWSIADPPHPANATMCADGSTIDDLSFPIPPGGSSVSPASFFLAQSPALQAAIQSRGTMVRYGQLPYTLPLNINVPQHSSDNGFDTQSGSLQFHGTVSVSAVGCPVSTPAVRAAGNQGQVCCPAPVLNDVTPDGGTFNGASPLVLHAIAAGGCPPYVFHWTRTRRPNGLQVTPSAPGVSSGSPSLTVKATCPLKGKPKRVSLTAWFDRCIGPVEYSVYVTGTSGPRSAIRYARNNWCVPQGKGTRDKCTVQVGKKLRQDWSDQAATHRADALAKALADAAAALADSTFQPGIGGIVGKAKDLKDWLENGKNLQSDTQTDTQVADKLDAAIQADPPNARTGAVALPGSGRPSQRRACVGLAGAGAAQALADCRTLLPPLSAYAAAEAQAQSVLSAVLTSQNRFATAARAGQANASALQHMVTGILYFELQGALTASDQAGLSVAQVGRSQGFFPIVTRAQIPQFARAIAKLRRLRPGVARALPGVTPSKLASDLGNARRGFPGRRLDLVSMLAHSLTQASSVRPADWVTAGGVRAVVTQLRAQGDLSAASSLALGQALDRIEAANGPAPLQQGLAEFNSAAQQVPAPARAFLLAASRALA